MSWCDSLWRVGDEIYPCHPFSIFLHFSLVKLNKEGAGGGHQTGVELVLKSLVLQDLYQIINNFLYRFAINQIHVRFVSFL